MGFVDKVALEQVCLLSTSVLIYTSRYVPLGSAGHVSRMRKKRSGYKVCIFVVVLCVFFFHLMCICCTVCAFFFFMPDCWLEVSIRKVLRPATPTQVFLGFPVPKSKC